MESINNMASAAAQAVWPNQSNGNATTETTNATADYNNNTRNYDGNYNNHSNIAANVAATSFAKTNTANTTATSGSPIPNNNEEPISGVLGDTSKGEPYDAGNKEEQDAANRRYSESHASAPGAGVAGTTGATGAAGVGGVAGATSVDNTVASSTSANNTANTTTGNTAANNDGSDNPAATSTAAGDAGMKDSKVPSSSGGETKIDGPGPRPIQEVARENHGDAGCAQSTGNKAAGGASGNAGDSAVADDDDDDKPESASHGEGTGEKYIRSSGLQADGGDFDAAREGAGREADRILEEKGISVGGGNQPGAADTAAAAPDGPNTNRGSGNSNGSNNSGTSTGNAAQGHKKKISLGEKIKNKIRRSS